MGVVGESEHGWPSGQDAWQADKFESSVAKDAHPMASDFSPKTVADTISQWSLNDDAQQVLFKQTPDVAVEVLTHFAPLNVEGRDVNGKFISFTNSVAKNMKGIGKGKGKSIL